MSRLFLLPLSAAGLLVASPCALADSTPKTASRPEAASGATDVSSIPIAELTSHTGKVHVLRSGEKISAQKGMKLFASDQLVTGPNSVAKVVFADGSSFVAFQEGSVEVESYWTSAHGPRTMLSTVLNLVRGKARFFFKPREGGLDATVKTANAVMGVRGTLFFVDSNREKSTSVVVVSGQVAVHNPQRPKEEVLVRANETTSVALEKSPEKPVVASVDTIKTLEEQASALPVREPDGEAPDSLTLPPPILPGDFQGNLKEKPPAGATVLRQVITPQYMVVPLTSVMVTKAGVGCDRKSLDRLRTSAQLLDPETVLLGRELSQCPVLASEALFWLGFHHIALGEIGRAVEAGRYAREEKVPLDVRTERERIIQTALEGNVDELQKQVKAKNPLYAKDAEGLLVLARTQARTGRFADARATFEEYLALPKLGPDVDVEIEKGYVLLLEKKYPEAEVHFESISRAARHSVQKESIARGLAMARANSVAPAGSENDHVEARFMARGSDDSQSWRALQLAWRSHRVDVELTPGVLTSDSEALGDFKAQTWHISVGKSWRLSSGTTLKGKVGQFQLGEQSQLTFDASGEYLFRMGLGLSAGFTRVPALSHLSLPEALAHEPLQRITTGVSFHEVAPGRHWLAYAFAAESLSDAMNAQSHRVTSHVAIHEGSRPGDFLLLRARFASESHSTESPSLATPKQLLKLGAGFELAWRMFDWMRVEADGESSLLFRDTRTVPDSNAISASKKRDAISQENGFETGFGTTFLWGKGWEASLGGRGSWSNDTSPKHVWGDWQAEGSVRWFYAR